MTSQASDVPTTRRTVCCRDQTSLLHRVAIIVLLLFLIMVSCSSQPRSVILTEQEPVTVAPRQRRQHVAPWRRPPTRAPRPVVPEGKETGRSTSTSLRIPLNRLHRPHPQPTVRNNVTHEYNTTKFAENATNTTTSQVLNSTTNSTLIPNVTLTATPSSKPRGGANIYEEIVHNRCRCKQPLIEQYERMFQSAAVRKMNTTAQRAPEWNPEAYGLRDPFRRFLRNWFAGVLEYRRRAADGHYPHPDTITMPPPEARVLLIGDSITRNTFYSMIVQTVDEEIMKEDVFGSFARHVVKSGGDSYQIMYVTWSSEPNGDLLSNRTASIQIRMEHETYFAMDTHSLYSSGGLDFNPTHIFIGRGMWDLVHGRPRDPATALSGMSAGLVRLRKELLEHRGKLRVEQRNLYPPPRIVYWALPKLFFDNPATQCVFEKDSTYFRDALYAAVRRANGALLHLHGEKNFPSMAIEIFDYYPLMMAAGAGNTDNKDCIHPGFTPRRAIIAQMLDLVSRPPRPQASVEQMLYRVEMKNETFLNATMYVPPPLAVRNPNTAADNSTSCPLAYTHADVVKILNPPKLTGVGAAAACSENMDDLTTPPLESIHTVNKKELFISMVQCGVSENMNYATVRPVETARRALEKVASNNNSATSDVSQKRSEYISACAQMIFSSLMGHRSTLAYYTSARRVPLYTGSSGASALELLWAGNRCLHFINSEAARQGPPTFMQQMWSYTEHNRMLCAVPPIVSWLFAQPMLPPAVGPEDGAQLVHCATKHGGVRMKMR